MKSKAVNIWSQLFVLAGLMLAGTKVAGAVTILGPDGAVAATVQTTSGNLNYSVMFHGVTVIETSALGVTVNGTNIGSGVTIGSTGAYATNEMFPSRHGIHTLGANSYQAQ